MFSKTPKNSFGLAILTRSAGSLPLLTCESFVLANISALCSLAQFCNCSSICNGIKLLSTRCLLTSRKISCSIKFVSRAKAPNTAEKSNPKKIIFFIIKTPYNLHYISLIIE